MSRSIRHLVCWWLVQCSSKLHTHLTAYTAFIAYQGSKEIVSCLFPPSCALFLNATPLTQPMPPKRPGTDSTHKSRGSSGTTAVQQYPAALSAESVALMAKQLTDTPVIMQRCCEGQPHNTLTKKLRTVALAACRLGHRSCHVLWGASDACKEVPLMSTARALRKCENVMVMEFHASLLQNDDDAIRQVAYEFDTFLSSSGSNKVKQRSKDFRSGTFSFAEVMQLDCVSGSITKAPNASAVPAGADSDDEEVGSAAIGEPDEPIGSTGKHVTLTTLQRRLYRTIRPGALQALNESLLLLMKHNVGIVVCVYDVARFGVWCDRMMYLVSGLMHGAEEDGAGSSGGMALMLTSSTADLRHTEKRLSSRLTCEMWAVPAPHASLRTVLCAAAVGAQTELAQLVTSEDNRASELRARRKQLLTSTNSRKAATKRPSKRSREEESDENIAVVQGAISDIEKELQCAQRKMDALLETSKGLQQWIVALQDADSDIFLEPYVTRDVLKLLEAKGNAWLDVMEAAFHFLAGHSSKRSSAAETPLCISRGSMVSDLLEHGLLVRLGYASREMLLLLAFATIRADRGVPRTIDELIHDIASHMTSSVTIKSIVPGHFKMAFAQLTSLRILGISHGDGVVRVCRRLEHVKQFLQGVLASPSLWDEGGLTMHDRHLLSPLIV